MKSETKEIVSKGDELMKKYHNGETVTEKFTSQMHELQKVMALPLNVTKLLKSNETNRNHS